MDGVMMAMLTGGVITSSGSEVLVVSLSGRGLSDRAWLYQRRKGVAVENMTEDDLC